MIISHFNVIEKGRKTVKQLVIRILNMHKVIGFQIYML